MNEQRSASALLGRRVLILRAPHQASDLAERLRALGAKPIQIPAIEIAPPASYADLDAALANLAAFDVVAFTSANAVAAFERRASHLAVDAVPRRVAAVGSATERALVSIRLHADVVPPVFTAEALAAALQPEAKDRSFLLVLGESASPALRDGLIASGARVTVAAAYSNRIPPDSRTAIASLFADPATHPDAVAFTSASTVHNLTALLDASGVTLPETVVRASIGPVTSCALVERGLPPHVEAAQSTVASLVECLAAHFLSGSGPKLY